MQPQRRLRSGQVPLCSELGRPDLLFA
eukprot:COSAG06_NODE_58547_length_276_cov_2.028249_1_plen_26_part_01